MKILSASIVLLTLLSFGEIGNGLFGWDEKYSKQFEKLSLSVDWGRDIIQKLTVDRWNKEKSYKRIRENISKLVGENKEKIVSVTRLEIGGNDCEAGPMEYSSIWLIAMNNGEVHIAENWSKCNTIKHYKKNERKQYWNIVKNLAQIKSKRAIESIDQSSCTAVLVYFISYYDKNQRYQLIYKTECGDENKDKDYFTAKKVVEEIKKFCKETK